MKANELMIGDILNLSENNKEIIPCEVVELHTEELLVIQPQDTACDIVGYDMIFPIPLTPEILENNNWIFMEGCDYSTFPVPSKWVCNFVPFTLTVEGESYIMARTFTIHYVHELQHALRLCGLTEMADNFKI